MMQRGHLFPTGLVVVKPTRENDGGLKPPNAGRSEVPQIRMMLRRSRVLIASFSDLLVNHGEPIKEAMRWCLQREAQIVVMGTGSFEDWETMRRGVTDRMPPMTCWATPTLEIAEILGILVKADSNHRVVQIRNGLCLVNEDGSEYVMARHWLAADNEAHDFAAMD